MNRDNATEHANITFRLPKTLRRELKQYCLDKDVSVADLLRRLVIQEIKPKD